MAANGSEPDRRPGSEDPSEPPLLIVRRLAAAGVERQTIVLGIREIEHRVERAGERIRRTVADASEAPVVLDELQDRRLVRRLVIDEVLLREG